MFLRKSFEMFRRTSIISVALYAQKLYCKINKSKPRAKAYRKPSKIYSIKLLEEQRAKSKILAKRIFKKTVGSSLWSWSLKITSGKLISSRRQQANFIPTDCGVSEIVIINGALPTQGSFHSVLLDKDFQCTSATALYLSQLEKGDIATLEYLFKKGYYYSYAEEELNELAIDNVSEDHASKFKINVSPRESLQGNNSSKELAEVDLIDKDLQCTSTTARYLSDLVEIDPSIIAMHSLHD